MASQGAETAFLDLTKGVMAINYANLHIRDKIGNI